MMSTFETIPTGMDDIAEKLRAVESLYDQGLFLQAYQAAAALGPLRRWPGAAGRVLAGRLASGLGSLRLGVTLHLLARRQYPGDEAAAYFGIRAKLYRGGPWAVWKLLKQAPPAADLRLRASGLAYRGHVLALLRDFQQARPLLAEAIAMAPDLAWLYLEQAGALALEDRIEAAVETVQVGLRLRPWYRPAVLMLANLYRSQARPDEAIALLRQGSEKLECGEIELDLAQQLSDRGDTAEAQVHLERAAAMFPLADKLTRQRLDDLRSELAYRSGDDAAAIEFASRIPHRFHEQLVENLRKARPEDRRVELPVPFVPQRHLTCGPATLTSLAKYWNRPAEHLAIAEQICYDGTSAQSERRWAEQAGFWAREFTVDWPTAVALIDRGAPFTLTTVDVTTAHLQAVIGYDARRGTLLIRDPSSSAVREMLATQGFEYLRGVGPRGMVMVPAEEAARVEGLTLGDAEPYDLLYALQLALDAHDRRGAIAAYQQMAQAAAGHRLTLQASRSMAYYDSDLVAALKAVDKTLESAPDSPSLLYAKLGLLKATASRAERLPFLEEISGRKDLDPIFRLHWAEELAEDARQHSSARQLLKQLLRQRPMDARCYYALGEIAWAARDFDAATELYRFAACLDDRQEGPSRTYFIASRHVRRTQEALDWLKDRWETLGNQSSLPAQTLFWAYESLDRTQQAFEVLETALQRRPDDDSLPLWAADAYGRYGKFESAAGLLEGCRQRVHEGSWLRAAAGLAGYRGMPSLALKYWRQVAAGEPQSAEAASAIATLLARLEGIDAATQFWRDLLRRFPYNLLLIRAAVPRLSRTEPALAGETLDRFIDAHPVEPWARRERALLRAAQSRYDEALADADLAITLSPSDTYGYSVRGNVLSQQGRLAEAAIDLRRALELYADNESAIHRWLANCRSADERTTALKYFHRQLVKQTTFGDGLLAYAELARPVLDGETLLSNLRQALQARPDLWQAWSAVTKQLMAVGRLDDAHGLAQRMTARFPLLPAVWGDMAAVCQVRGDAAGEIAALRKALEINGNWAVAIFRLVEAHTRQNRLLEARTIVEQALHRLPDVAPLHAYRADLCWRMTDRDAAVASLTQALEYDPDYPWAWERLQHWGVELDQPDLAIRTARSLTARRPGESRCWHWLAAVLTESGALEERLAAARRAIELDRHSVDSQVLYSRLLSAVGRFDEALALCRSSDPAVRVPHELRAQEASVLRERGQVSEAVDALRAVLAENPDYTAGWMRLATWCAGEAELIPVQIEAARQLVRLNPHETESWCHLGRAAERSDREEAKRAWTHALELAPDNTEAAIALFDLQFADQQFEAAGQTLRAIEALNADHYVWTRRVRWAASRAVADPTMALGAFDRLGLVDTADPAPLSDAAKIISERGWKELLASRLAQLVTTPQHNRHVLSEWVELKIRSGDVRAAFRELDAHPEPVVGWNLAAARLLNECEYYSRRKLKRFVVRNAKRLAADPLTWGTVGFAFCHRNLPRLATRWLSDYRQRKGVEPWMIHNLTFTLWQLNQPEQARLVSEYALTLSPDHTTAKHRLWMAVSCAIAGEATLSEAYLAVLGPNQENLFDRILWQIARNTLAERSMPRSRFRWLGCWGIEGRFRRALYPHGSAVKNAVVLRNVYLRALQSLLRAAGYRTAPYWLPWVRST